MVWNVDLTGKAFVVTGGNRGIGLAISHQIAQAGGHVAIFYKQSADAPQRAKEIEEKYNVRSKAYQVDVSDQKAVHELVGTVYKDIGPIGGVVCDAGVAVSKPAVEMTKEDFQEQFEPNVWGLFTVAQAAAKLWTEHQYQNGKIVFVASISGSIANRGSTQCFYNSSKGAVTSLAQTLAMEWAPLGITVNCLSPGYVETDMTAGMLNDKEKRKGIEDQAVLGRVSQPDEQAGTVVFFLSDYASCAVYNTIFGFS